MYKNDKINILLIYVVLAVPIYNLTILHIGKQFVFLTYIHCTIYIITVNLTKYHTTQIFNIINISVCSFHDISFYYFSSEWLRKRNKAEMIRLFLWERVTFRYFEREGLQKGCEKVELGVSCICFPYAKSFTCKEKKRQRNRVFC